MRTLFILLFVAILGTGYWYWQPNTDSYQYQTVAVTQGKVEKQVVSSGTLGAVTLVEVGSQVSGQIIELLVDYNDKVVAGQLIAKLDNSSYLAKVSQLDADVAMAKAALGEKKAEVLKAQANADKSLQDLKRVRSLLAKNFTSQSDIDSYEAEYKVSLAELTVAKAQVVSAQAYIEQKQAAFDEAQVNLEETEIRSPITGVVLDRLVSEGETVAASMTTPVLFSIAGNLSDMQIEAFIDEADIAQVKEGQAVRFTVDAWPEKNFVGQLSQVRKAATDDSSVVTYTVVISVDNKEQLLLPGMTANTEIITASKENVLRIPNSVLRFKPSEQQDSKKQSAEQMLSSYEALKLTDEQKKLITAEFEKQKPKSAAPAGAGAGPGPGNDPSKARSAKRNRLGNVMRKVLDEQQFAQYKAMQSNHKRVSRTGKRENIWILDEAQNIKKVTIYTGMQDDQYTELLNSDLKAGDKVVNSAQKG